MIRRGRHKYIRCPGDPDLLYDLADDPLELRNLAGEAGRRAARGRLPGRERRALGPRRARADACSQSQRARRLVARALAQRRLRPLGLPAVLRTPRCCTCAARLRRASDRAARAPPGGLPPPERDRPRRTSSWCSPAWRAVIDTPGGWSEAGACDERCQAPCQLRLQERFVSHPMHRRVFRRAFASSLAIACAPLVAPAAALADGQLDTTFNGTGYHVGSAAEGTIFSQHREPHPDDRAGRRQDRRRRRARRRS